MFLRLINSELHDRGDAGKVRQKQHNQPRRNGNQNSQ